MDENIKEFHLKTHHNNNKIIRKKVMKMIYINEDLCKGCFICVDCCPVGVYVMLKMLKLNV